MKIVKLKNTLITLSLLKQVIRKICIIISNICVRACVFVFVRYRRPTGLKLGTETASHPHIAQLNFRYTKLSTTYPHPWGKGAPMMVS